LVYSYYVSDIYFGLVVVLSWHLGHDAGGIMSFVEETWTVIGLLRSFGFTFNLLILRNGELLMWMRMR